MRIDIDLDYCRITATPGYPDPIPQLDFKRGVSTCLPVRFWRAGAIVELAEGAVGKFGIKPAGKYDGQAIVLAEEWTKTGAAETTVYSFIASFSSAALAALLGSGDGITTNDNASVPGMTEIEWTESGNTYKTQTVTTYIANDVLKSSDGTPLDLPTPALWLLGNTAPNAASTNAYLSIGTIPNQLIIAATELGEAGNFITVEVILGDPTIDTNTVYDKTITSTGLSFVIVAGMKARLSIAGNLHNSNGDLITPPMLYYADQQNGMPIFTDTQYVDDAHFRVYYSSPDGMWIIEDTVFACAWNSFDDVRYPDLVTTWTPMMGATGTPVLTALTPSLGQIANLINTDPAASALLYGDLTGDAAITAIAATHLSGGTSVTLAPPYLRVADGFLYVQEAGAWKKTALSEI